MKQKSPHEESATRIKQFKSRLPQAGQEKQRSAHRYELLTTHAFLKPHTQKKGEILSKANIQQMCVEQKEKESAGAAWSQAAQHAHLVCVSQKHPSLIFLESILAHRGSLDIGRVHFWQLKGKEVAQRNLKRETSAANQEKKRTITHLKEEVEKEEESNELWQTAYTKEELFRVGRIDKG